MNKHHDIKDISLADFDQHILETNLATMGLSIFLERKKWTNKPASRVHSLPETALPFYADYRLQSGHFSGQTSPIRNIYHHTDIFIS
jgi:hypothetical protein